MNIGDSYITPVSVDTFGNFPGALPGDTRLEHWLGKLYLAEVLPGPSISTPYGAVLRNVRYTLLAGCTPRHLAH